MPKYYVNDGVERAVVDAADPLAASIKALMFRFNTVAIGGFLFISEKGFDTHKDDIVLRINDVLNYLMNR